MLLNHYLPKKKKKQVTVTHQEVSSALQDREGKYSVEALAVEKCLETPKHLSLPHLCVSLRIKVITTPTSSHLQNMNSAFFIVWLSMWGSGGSTQAGCKEGRIEGAEQHNMFVPIWRCYTGSQSLLLHHLNGQHGS